MDKFIEKASEILSRLNNIPEGERYGFEYSDKCQDILLDAKILCHEFGCEPIYQALISPNYPNERTVRCCLDKLIETAKFRSK